MKMNKKISLVVLLVICLSVTILFAGCGGADIKSISVDAGSADVIFEVGTEFNAENLVVYAKQKDGKNIRIPIDEYTVSNPDISTVGPKTVTVTYKEMTATYSISVVELEEVATFRGDITVGLGAGNTLTYTADFICYNTLKWELWYKDGHPSMPSAGSYSVKDSGKYKLTSGVYSMILTTHTANTVTDDTGAVSFDYVGLSLPVAGGALTGIFNGTLILVS